MTTLTMQDEKRLDVIQHVYRSGDGATHRTDDQTKRTAMLPDQSAGEQAGAKGVVHGNRGRHSKRKLKERIVKRVLELAR